MKENFSITITTLHVENDRGRLENVSYKVWRLSEESMSITSVVWGMCSNVRGQKEFHSEDMYKL